MTIGGQAVHRMKWVTVWQAVVLLLVSVTTVQAETDTASSLLLRCDATRGAQLDALVQQRLAMYRRAFPDIQFVLLPSQDDPVRSLSGLRTLLGREADNLDYAHPASVRTDLLDSALARVETLLRISSSSSALFHKGRDGQADRDEVCVVTLNACATAADDRQATRNMLDLPDALMARIPEHNHLDADRHLEFVIDHEVHHCLMVHAGMPIPMSHRTYWPGYMQRRNEIAADAYGLALHLLKHGSSSTYTRNLLHLRGLSLLVGDPDHFTTAEVGATLADYCGQVDTGTDIERAFEVSLRALDSFDWGYDDYLKYRYAAYQAMTRLGLYDPHGPRLLDELHGASPDPARTLVLLRETLQHYQALFEVPLFGPDR